MDAAAGNEFQDNTARTGEFCQKLSTELTELTTAFDDVVEQLRRRSATLLSTETRVDSLLGSIRLLDAGIDEMMMRLSQLDAAAVADPTCASKLHAELKVWAQVSFTACELQ